MHGALQDVHISREPGCDKRRVNDTDIDRYMYNYSYAGAVVMINVGLAQARRNYIILQCISSNYM